MKNKTHKLEKLSDIELIKQYSQIISMMKERKLLKSKSAVGDIGRHYAMDFYNNSSELATLQSAPYGIQNINAMSKQGERYVIKTTTKALTGDFYGLEPQDSYRRDTKKFERVIIVFLSDNFELKRILELTWSQFLEVKNWNKTNKAWNISVTKEVIAKAKTIFVAESKEGGAEDTATF